MNEKNPHNYEELYWDLVELSYSAVHGYEKYLLNKISSADLAKIMKLVYEELPNMGKADTPPAAGASDE